MWRYGLCRRKLAYFWRFWHRYLHWNLCLLFIVQLLQFLWTQRCQPPLHLSLTKHELQLYNLLGLTVCHVHVKRLHGCWSWVDIRQELKIESCSRKLVLSATHKLAHLAKVCWWSWTRKYIYPRSTVRQLGVSELIYAQSIYINHSDVTINGFIPPPCNSYACPYHCLQPSQIGGS